MKQVKFLLPVVTAVVMLLGSCIPAPSIPAQPDTNKIIEDIRTNVTERIAEHVQLKMDELTSSINDTIFSVNTAGDSVKIARTAANGLSTPVTVTIQKLSVNVPSNDSYDFYRIQRDHMRMTQATIISIVFGALILAIALAVLIFLYRRLKSRNAIIAKAIENNYQLPEVFYSGSNEPLVSFGNRGARDDKNDESYMITPVNPDAPEGEKQATPIPPVYRNQRNFDKGWRNVAIGVGIIIIFNVWDAPAAAVLGIIPLFIGAGQLLSYYNIFKR